MEAGNSLALKSAGNTTSRSSKLEKQKTLVLPAKNGSFAMHAHGTDFFAAFTITMPKQGHVAVHPVEIQSGDGLAQGEKPFEIRRYR